MVLFLKLTFVPLCFMEMHTIKGNTVILRINGWGIWGKEKMLIEWEHQPNNEYIKVMYKMCIIKAFEFLDIGPQIFLK